MNKTLIILKTHGKQYLKLLFYRRISLPMPQKVLLTSLNTCVYPFKMSVQLSCLNFEKKNEMKITQSSVVLLKYYPPKVWITLVKHRDRNNHRSLRLIIYKIIRTTIFPQFIYYILYEGATLTQIFKKVFCWQV